MTPEQIDNIVKQLRALMGEEADDAVFMAMREAYQAIRAWMAEEQREAMPYLQELQQWGIAVPEAVQARLAKKRSLDKPQLMVSEPEQADNSELEQVDAAIILVEEPEQFVAPLPTTLTLEELPAAEADVDDALQNEFEEAVALLRGRRFYAARQAFSHLEGQAAGRLRGDIYRYLDETRQELAIQVADRSERARTHAEKQPNDLRGQRKLWEKVLEADPAEEAALATIQRLDVQEMQQRLEDEISAVREDAAEAVKGNRLTELNRILARAEAAQQRNQLPNLRLVLDDLVGDVTRQRDEARARLGRASTLSVSGNTREGYRQAREYVNQGLREVFDQAGILGKAGAEVDPLHLLHEARRRFLQALEDIAKQRLDKAGGEKGPNPAIALETLEDAQSKLTDPILTKEDRDELTPTLTLIEETLADVRERLTRFNKAAEKVVAAGAPGIEQDDKYRLYLEARELYPEYPSIETYIQQALRTIANREATRLMDEMTSARRQLEQDAFQAALDILKQAREHARRQVSEPESDSELALRLGEVTKLEEEIVTAEGAYNRMMATLAEVEHLLNSFEEQKQPGLLATARSRLEQLSDTEKAHPETRKQRARLIELQGAGESWEEGQNQYRLGYWDEAVPLLERVAKSDVAEKNEAVRLLNRARATRRVLEARQAETERNLREALVKYQAATDLFESFGTDVYTGEFERSAKGSLERLRSLEGNDQEVRQALQFAKGQLAQAVTRATARTSPLERVEGVEEFQRAVNALQTIRHKETTLALELETTLSQSRQQWRSAYLGGMQSVLNSDDLVLLRKGVGLGEVLKANELLYETADRDLFRKIQEKYLDAEWKRLRNNPPSPESLQQELDRLKQQNIELNKGAIKEKGRELELLQRDPLEASALIEDNRRRRLEVADVKTDELQQQYQSAMAQRVRFQLGQQRQTSLQSAILFLKEELNKPELYQNMELFEELMRLLWEQGDWSEAEQRASSLSYRQLPQARRLSELWVGMTNGARLLADGNREQFEAEMNRLEGATQVVTSGLALRERQREWLKRWRVERLLQQVSKYAGENKEAQITQAQLYAEAHQLMPADIRVQTGLRQLGRQLGNVLGVKCRQAHNLSLVRSLDFSLKEARRLQETLEGIQGIANELGLTQEQGEELQSALEMLEKKIKPWQKLQSALKVVEEEKKKALTQPLVIQGQQEGGWQMGAVEARLREARASVDQNDRELNRLLADKGEALNHLSTVATELNEVVRDLRIALTGEDFPQVMEKASELERLWPQRLVDGFDGLTDVLRYNDPFQRGKNIARPDEHRKRSQQQQGNLEAWQEWADSVKRSQEVSAMAATFLNRDLKQLVQNKSLRDIAADCRDVLDMCEQFEEALLAKPEVDPLSNKAVAAQARVSSAWEGVVLDTATGFRGKAAGLLNEIDEQVKQMQKPLRDLNAALKQLNLSLQPRSRFLGMGTQEPDDAVVKQWMKTAKRHLATSREMDPLNKEVVAAHQQIRDLETQYGEVR